MRGPDSMKPSPEEKLERMDETIKRFHAEQTRGNGEPYWHHCRDVSAIISDVAEETDELSQDPELLTDLKLAALGHDLLEDTSITRGEIEGEFGERVLSLIDELTNEEGDEDRRAYLGKMRNASEEAKLVKLADMTENCLSVANSLHELGLDWTRNFFLPIINEMKANIQLEQFVKYKKTAAKLVEKLDFAYKLLQNNISNYSS